MGILEREILRKEPEEVTLLHGHELNESQRVNNKSEKLPGATRAKALRHIKLVLRWAKVHLGFSTTSYRKTRMNFF